MSRRDNLRVAGARTHNLKDVTVEFPRGRIVAFTGLSGSGKSSLVFDTIYTEAQRQLVETFSSFARRRLPKLSRPPVDDIGNLATPILVDQKPMGRTLRSTVGTATEIATYLRMLYSRWGEPQIGPSFCFSFNNPEGMCRECMGLGKKITVDVAAFLDPSKSLRDGALLHPDYRVGGFFWRELLMMEELFDADRPLGEWAKADLDRLLNTEPIPVTKRHGAGTQLKNFEGLVRRLERHYVNKADDEVPEEEKNVYTRFLSWAQCPACAGTRLNERALSAKVAGRGIAEVCALEIGELDAWLGSLRIAPAEPVIGKMRRMAGHLLRAGVGYLSLDRAVSTLSGGEGQRVKMARQLDCDLTGLLYVLDEPSTGLHPKDREGLVAMLAALRDAGNSVLVVEHDPQVIRCADWIVELGPKAGRDGGALLYSGEPAGLAATGSATARALAGESFAPAPRRRRWTEAFEIRDARGNNLKGVSVRIPKGAFTCVTGVAGSGKSTLVHDVFVKAHPEAVVVDQLAVGRTSRGTPASYLGAFDLMRKELAKALQADAGLFSFNSKGACGKCGGAGFLAIEMNFLDDVRMTCDACEGRRYNDEVLALQYKGLDIGRILALTAEEAAEFFESKEIRRRFALLRDTGLGYLAIGQPLSTLSGGECQRLKLASELHKSGGIYVMDEPTTGLHPADVARLMAIVDRLADGGNTVVVIEHDTEVAARADWVIDLGPGGGRAGGELLVQGPPEEVARCERSHTGRFLRELLRARAAA